MQPKKRADVEEPSGAMTASEIQAMLDINPNALDEEWLRQSGIVMSLGEMWVNACAERDAQKDNIKIIEAAAQAAVRTNPESYGIVKVTEAQVAAAVDNDQEVAAARQELVALSQAASILQIGRDAANHRKDALNALTQLYLSGYFGDKPKKEIKAGVHEAQDTASSRAQHKGLNKK